MHAQKRRKKSERGVTDIDNSQNVLKLKAEGAVQSRLVMPQSAPVKSEDKCNVLSAQFFVIKKLVPLFTILYYRHSQKTKTKEIKLLNVIT